MLNQVGTVRAVVRQGRRRIAVIGLALLATWALAACSVNEVAPGEALQADAEHGLVVLSVTHSGQRGYDLLFKIDGPGGSLADRILRLYAYGRTRDWNGVERRGPTPAEEPDGRLLVLRLKPGTYRIDHWKGTTNLGGLYGDGFEVFSEPVTLTFTARAGETVYAGNVHIALPLQLNYLANLTPSTYRIETGDKQARDLDLLRRKFPAADLQNVRTALVDFPKAGQPLRYYIYNFHNNDDNDIFLN